MQFFTFGLDKFQNQGSVELLGGKGAGLAWLASEGVPVPPGFVIPTSVWAEYEQKPKTTMKAIAKALPAYLKQLEKHFGYMPLLSVRSGARVSCPGMMDTILNVGIDADSTAEWVKRLGPTCFGDSFHRLVSMYGSVVNGINKDSLKGNLKSALNVYEQQTGSVFPDAQDQLLGAIEAVFKSWDNDRANEYRKIHGYDRAWGTAVTVQAMVFGNLNDQSATGVLFTRNPDTGAAQVTGEWLPNAQGEDIVAGIRTPLSMGLMGDWNNSVAVELGSLVVKLEQQRQEMLDIEWTVQDGKLYLLQVRSGKRSAKAAIKIAVDMAKEGLIDPTVAIKRVTTRQFDLAQMVTLDPKWTKKEAFVGIPACSGIVSGKPVFTKEDAISCKEPCILVRHETTPDDVAGMFVAKGVITMVGGMTSHAAVVARGMSRACIVGVSQDIESFKDIEVLSMDGATGRIWTEKVPTVGGTSNEVVQEYNQLVCNTLGVVPVLFDAPLHKMPEALLYLGDKVLDTQKATKMVCDTLGQVDRLYLDLVPSTEEMRYLSILTAHNHTKRLLDTLASGLTGTEGKRLVVIAAADQQPKFERILPGATDLRTLVMSGKELVIEGIDLSDPAIQRVLAWKKSEGVTGISIGARVEGCKSMLSIEQALQVLNEVQ